MKAKKRLNIILTIAIVFALCASAIFGLTGATKVKADEIACVKKLTLNSNEISGITAVQANTAIALGENQYVEMIFDFENMPDAPYIDLAFAATRARVESEIESGLGESLTVLADAGGLRGQVTSDTAKYITSGWGNRGNTGTLTWLQWVNGNATLGSSNVATGSYRLRYRVYADGTAVLFTANAGEENYFAAAVVGYIYNGAAWVKDDGITIAASVFPTLRFRSCPSATISYYETAVYNYENVCDGANFLDGTLVENSKYVETFDATTSELRIISGSAKVVTTTGEYKTVVDYPVSGDLVDSSAVEGANFVPNTAGQIVSVYGDKITLVKGQYAEAVYDLSGVSGGWFETKFIGEKPTSAETFGYESGEGLLIVNEGRAKVYSDNADKWYCGWGNPRGVGGDNYCWINYLNGNNTLGVTPASDSLRLKVRIYDDGSAIYYFATAGQENWFGFAYVGWKHNGSAWVKDGKGLAPLGEGYFALGFRNTAAPKLTAFTAGVYNYDAAQGEAAGTLQGELYTEKFGADTKTEVVCGKADICKLSAALSANAEKEKITYDKDNGKLVIDNAADNGYVYSRFALPANVDSLLGEFSLEISELSGTAKAVVYFGADDNALTNAGKLTFSLNAEGKVVVSDGTNSVVTDLKVGEKFKLAIAEGTENKVMINDKAVEGLTVTALSGKYFAIGLNGVTESDKAKIVYYGITCKGIEQVSSESEFAPAILPYPTKVATPVVTIDENGVASWVAIENAGGYKYVIDNGEEITTTETSVTLTKKQTIKVMALGSGEIYLDGEYSAEVIYTVAPVKLGTPIVTVDENGVASWAAIENASGYKYVIDNGTAVTTDKTSVTLTDGQSIKVMAVGDGEDYADGEYSESKKFTKPQESSGSGDNSGSSDNGSGSAEKKGCFGSVGSVSAILVVMLALVAVKLFGKKRA